MTVWLITGCSSGFGEALAYDALSRGDKVIATARNSSRLTKLAEKGAHVLELDVSSSSEEIKQVVADAHKVYGRIDILINNAGVALGGAVEEISQADWQAAFATNLFGPIYLSQAVIPYMREQKSGVIAMISSVGAWAPFASAGPYCSTKSALSAFAGVLAIEVKHFGIDVIALEPGYFRTPLPENAVKAMKIETRLPAYEGSAVRQMDDLFSQIGGSQPGDVAKGVKVINDILTKKGGREIPTRLLLGPDAIAMANGSIDNFQAVQEEWKDIILSTNHDAIESASLSRAA